MIDERVEPKPSRSCRNSGSSGRRLHTRSVWLFTAATHSFTDGYSSNRWARSVACRWATRCVVSARDASKAATACFCWDFASRRAVSQVPAIMMGLRPMKIRLIGLRMKTNITTPMISGASMASQGNRERCGAPGAWGSSSFVSVGRASTRGERTKAISVDCQSGRVRIACTRMIVSPSRTSSLGVSVARATRPPETNTPLEELRSAISTLSGPTRICAWVLDTRRSLSCTSLSAVRPIELGPNGRCTSTPWSGPATTLKIAAASRCAPRPPTSSVLSSSTVPDWTPESIRATPAGTTWEWPVNWSFTRRVRFAGVSSCPKAPASASATSCTVAVASAVTWMLDAWWAPGARRLTLSFIARLLLTAPAAPRHSPSPQPAVWADHSR